MVQRYHNQPPAAWFRQQVIDLQKGRPHKREKIFASLMRELLPILRRIALRQQQNLGLGAYGPEIAEDAVSEACVKFLQRLDTFREPYDVVSWFYLVISNLLHDERKRRNRVVTTEEDYLLNQKWHDTSEILSGAGEVRQIVRFLSPEQRLVVYLYYWEEMSARQIAERHGISHQAVAQQLERARKRIKILLVVGGTKDARWADTRTS